MDREPRDQILALALCYLAFASEHPGMFCWRPQVDGLKHVPSAGGAILVDRQEYVPIGGS